MFHHASVQSAIVAKPGDTFRGPLQPERPDDAIDALASGDLQTAASLLDRRYRGHLEHIAARSGVPRGDCADVAQDALIAALGQIERGVFRGDSSIGTWLFTIVL